METWDEGKAGKPRRKKELTCYEIQPIDSIRRLNIGDPSDDVILVADKGPVALRDFPHPRHLCGNLPFNTSPHEEYCSKCFCYECEIAAPCLYWKGSLRHCDMKTKLFK